MGAEQFQGEFLPNEFRHVDGLGGNERSERKQEIGEQLRDYISAFSRNMQFDNTEVATTYGEHDLLNPQIEIGQRAERIALVALNRNNEMAHILASALHKGLQKRQRGLRGRAAVGKLPCIDGRIPSIHIDGTITGVQETMAGCVDTTEDKLTGRVMLKSQTLARAIEDRPFQSSPQLLEIAVAHAEARYSPDGSVDLKSNCGAMALFESEAKESGHPFDSDDLIEENFKLARPSMDAITTTYNAAAAEAGQPELEKVAIRAVFDTRHQGTILGYGEDKPPLSTAALTEDLSDEIREDLSTDPRLNDPGYFRSSFTEISRFLEKEEVVTDMAEYLLQNSKFKRTMREAALTYGELEGLTDDQLQALEFMVARNIAFQYLTGLHKRELSRNSPFREHNELYQAITVDDGYGATIGKHDPQTQVFEANLGTLAEAVDHIDVQVQLMSKHGADVPYVIFLCSGIAEGKQNDPDVRKQARTTVGRTFHGITQNDRVASLIKAGKLVPIPAIVSSETNEAIEIPNLMR